MVLDVSLNSKNDASTKESNSSMPGDAGPPKSDSFVKSKSERDPDTKLTFVEKVLEQIWRLKLPFIGHLALQRQIRILFLFLLGSLLFVAFLGTLNRQEDMTSVQSQLLSDVLIHTQRIGKVVPNAIRGDSDAFRKLKESYLELNVDLNLLTPGRNYQGNGVESARAGDLAARTDGEHILSATENAAGTILKLKSELTAFAETVKKLTTSSPGLLKLSEEIAAKKLQLGGSPREVAAANRLTTLVLQLQSGVNEFFTDKGMSSNTIVLLKSETATFSALIDGLLNGSGTLQLAPTKKAEIRKKLNDLKTTFNEYQRSVSMLESHLQSYIAAKQAGQSLLRDNEELRSHLLSVQTNYRNQLDSLSVSNNFSDYFMLTGFAIALLAVSSMALVFLQDSHAFEKEAKLLRVQSEMQKSLAKKRESEAKQVNDQNQAAILRLMNELQEVADGDLTIRATVSEDITGAIADSLNYTVEELRGLIGRITSVAEQVISASNQAEEVSSKLLETFQQQSREINETGNEIITMAGQITRQENVSAEGTVQRIKQILSLTEQSQEGAQHTAQSIHELSALAQELKSAVSRFRVTV